MGYPNWFRMTAAGYFERHLRPLAGKPGLRFLQVGAFTGDASRWLLDEILIGDDSKLVDVDTWGGSDEAIHRTFDWSDVERVYDERTADAQASGRLEKLKGTSAAWLAGYWGAPFDFIYIDGGHTAFDVLNDGVAAYRLLKHDGLIAFDDYTWQSGKGDPHDPRLAIDAIMAIYQGRLDLVDIGGQAWFRRAA